MPLVCPRCSGGLEIVQHLRLPPADDDDEISIQKLYCRSYACAIDVGGVYTESRGGSDSRFHHRGRVLTEQEASELRALLSACPAPGSTTCRCPSHVALMGRSGTGYKLGAAEDFPLRIR